MFTKGITKIGGRQAGTPNRLTGAFREAVLLAYDNIGGHEAFSRWASANPTEFYRIAARLIPVEVRSGGDNKVIVHIHRDLAKALPVDIAKETPVDITPHVRPPSTGSGEMSSD